MTANITAWFGNYRDLMFHNYVSSDKEPYLM